MKRNYYLILIKSWELLLIAGFTSDGIGGMLGIRSESVRRIRSKTVKKK